MIYCLCERRQCRMAPDVGLSLSACLWRTPAIESPENGHEIRRPTRLGMMTGATRPGVKVAPVAIDRTPQSAVSSGSAGQSLDDKLMRRQLGASSSAVFHLK